jgi:hypothetical protein
VEGTSVTEPSESQQEIGLAFWKSLDDITGSVNVQKTKKNVTEEIRAFVRAQQLIGYISEAKGLTVDILKRNHRNFGNNPSEKIELQVAAKQFKVMQVVYLKRELENYWRESKWKPQLTQIFITLIRESWRAIPPDILYKNLSSNILSLDEFVKVYCATPHEEPVKGARGKTEIHMRVPSKPKENNMLLKAEQTFLNEMNAKLFGNTYYEANASEWVELLLGDGLRDTKDYLQSLYKARAVYVRAFAALTTKRLTEIRKHVPECSRKRKKDVTSKDVTALLTLREDPLASFVDEVLQMDPNLNSFLGVYLSDKEGNVARLPGEERQLTKELLENLIREKEIYKDLERNVEQLNSWNRYVLEKSNQYLRKKAILEEYHRNLKQGAILASMPEYKRGGIDDLIKVASQSRQKTKSSLTKGVKGKSKEKTAKKVGFAIGPSEQDIKDSSEAIKIAEERNARLIEFKKDLRLSENQYTIIYGDWFERIHVDREEDETPKVFYDRIIRPLWNKIQDDRDDVEVYIMCLGKFLEEFNLDEVKSIFPNIDYSSYEASGALEFAILVYNQQRHNFMPKAVYTL